MAQSDAPSAAESHPAAQQVPGRAWWLSTGRHRAEWQALVAAGTATFEGTPRAHYLAARPGDPVFIYLSRPDHGIRAMGVVGTSNAGATGAGPRLEVHLAFELPGLVPWRDVSAAPALAEAEPVRKRSSGSLFRLEPAEYLALKTVTLARNPEADAAFASLEAGKVAAPRHAPEEPARVREEGLPYRPDVPAPQEPALPPSGLPAVESVDRLASLTGLSCDFISDLLDLLAVTRQIVLTGPPGTGKTWLARGLAALAAGDPGRVAVVQFHPGTTYEDFIEGLKPQVDAVGRVTYAVLPGLFARLCMAARADPAHNYVLLADEINRAPLSRVFGELLYALEYRGAEGGVELSASAGAGEPFYVPANLLIVGTMNSADRSLALVDYALRRRFRFVELEPDAVVLDSWLADHGNGARARRVVLDLFSEVNRRLSEQLDADHRLGHSYFMLAPLTARSVERLWGTAVRPLLHEYFLPSAGEVEEYELLFKDAADELRESG